MISFCHPGTPPLEELKRFQSNCYQNKRNSSGEIVKQTKETLIGNIKPLQPVENETPSFICLNLYIKQVDHFRLNEVMVFLRTIRSNDSLEKNSLLLK